MRNIPVIKSHKENLFQAVHDYMMGMLLTMMSTIMMATTKI